MPNPALHCPPAPRHGVSRALHVGLLALVLCAFGPLDRPAQAQIAPGGSLFQTQSSQDTKLDDPRPEGGWQGLANLLEKAKPGVDTRLDPTPAQVTYQIESLLAAGRLDEALALVKKRQAELERQGPRGGGTDVQLQFQHARTLTALGRNAEAKTLYTELTTLYPELPEPWNNLAVLRVAQGNLEGAAQALQNALLANPRDNIARGNLADVQLMMAQCNYRKAGRARRSLPTLNPDALAPTP
jgi:tetratricopeptide (TPR) repeat protein